MMLSEQLGGEWFGKRVLVTGAAGFIGSHLAAALVRAGARVRGFDNFSTGKAANVTVVAEEGPGALEMVEGGVEDASAVRRAAGGVEIIFHLAAMGSVPRSIEEPLAAHASNVTGFLNVLDAAREEGVRRVVYASSSAVYGDDAGLPKVEDRIGRPLSPYATTKRINELYADVYEQCYNLSSAGLRYFNVYGPRQDPAGAYAAVIPRWFAALADGHPVEIYGDGLTSRDFCFVADVVRANLLAAMVPLPPEAPRIFNIAGGVRATLNELYEAIREEAARRLPGVAGIPAVYREFRAGDIRHSHADTGSARRWLGFEPAFSLADGLAATASFFLDEQR